MWIPARIAFLSLALFLTIPYPAYAATQGSEDGMVTFPDNPEFSEKLTSLFRDYANEDRFSGCMLVADGTGNVIRLEQGFADRTEDVLLNRHSRLKIFSISKRFTATAVMQLVQNGDLELDDTVASHISWLPESWSEVTVHQLLNHTSGIPDFSQLLLEEFSGDFVTTMESVADQLSELGLQFTPGSDWSYSNAGYTLLGAVIEQCSGLAYDEYIHRHIFQPAGMLDSSVELPPDGQRAYLSDPEPVAVGYNRSENGDISEAVSRMYVIAPAGGIISTTGDMYRYLVALNNGVLLDKEFQQLAIDNAWEVNEKTDSGYGWFIGRTDQGWKRYTHTGGTNGFVSDLTVLPEAGLVMILMSNTGWAEVGSLKSDLLELIAEYSETDSGSR